jgi:hypothetical protein
MLRIRDILVRIMLFWSVTFKMATKNYLVAILLIKFLCLLPFEATFTSFFEDKSHKEVTKQ